MTKTAKYFLLERQPMPILSCIHYFHPLEQTLEVIANSLLKVSHGTLMSLNVANGKYMYGTFGSLSLNT